MVSAAEKTVKWTEDYPPEGVELLHKEGSLIVSPTKVGYILVAVDKAGLERKFDAKQRKRNKPGVVLIADFEQLLELAELNEEIEELYRRHWDDDKLLGCILPWRTEALQKYVHDGAEELMTDTRKTSCFVIKYGKPTEILAKKLWDTEHKLLFASSANPSGVGNKGKVTGIGQRIEEKADLIVEADHYVASIQQDKDENTRYEQGVMVSMVDDQGQLVPLQKGERQVFPAPVFIRRGLYTDYVLDQLADIFTTWDYRHGQYY